MVRDPPATYRQRRSLLLGFAALVGGGLMMWKWENRGPTFFDKLARLLAGTGRAARPTHTN
jgi:hypothetical protein